MISDLNPKMNHIENNYKAICLKLGAKPKNLSTPKHDGSAHVEYINNKYHFVITEHGAELERKIAKDTNELFFWLADELIVSMALSYELNNRIESQDFRRIYFAKCIELHESINGDWAKLKQKELNDILKEFPYSDQI